MSVRLLVYSAGAYLAAILWLVISQATLGSPTFLVAAAVVVIAYVVVLRRVWGERSAGGRLLLGAIGLAVAFRLPLALAPVGADSDMVRYLWDGRVQRQGLNPYTVVPADPSLAWTHTDQTAIMPSRHDRTPYPPAAQLFFRLVVTVWNSTLGMKLALLACDLATIVVVRRWLRETGRSEWLALVYAWNPLVVFEVAHSGHIDALGALWIAAAALWLTRRQTMRASLAFVLAVATKLVPIVLLPLFIGRVRIRDAVAGAALMAALYVPFVSGDEVPLGAVPNVVEHIRFNGPVFRTIALASWPQAAAVMALVLAAGTAVWARWRGQASDPWAWALPMGVAIACAPVIYPWYLLYVTPFLLVRATLPLLVWTISILPVYLVWERSIHGHRWVVPGFVLALEFGAVLLAIGLLARTAQAPDAKPLEAPIATGKEPA